MTGEVWPRALARLTGRNRRRYGGYLVHAGIAVLFLGVAASSAFLDQRDVRLSPGDLRDRRLQGDLPRGHRPARRRRSGTGAPIAFGAVLDVRKDGEPSRSGPRATSTRAGTRRSAPSRASSRARPPARSTCAGACARTSGSPCGPTSARSRSRSRRPTRKFADTPGDVQALIIAARRALPDRPAAGRVPGDRLAARGLDLDRRGDRGAGRAGGDWPTPEAGCAACAPSTRHGSARSSRAR